MADLAALNIYTVGDLLEHYPRQESYADFSRLKTISELTVDGTKQLFKAKVHRVRDGFGSRRMNYTVVTVRDETGYADIYFFLHSFPLTHTLIHRFYKAIRKADA